MKFYKKNCVLLLILVLFLSSCNGTDKGEKTNSSANGNINIDISFIKDMNRVQIAVGNNKDIYLTDGNRIYILDSNGNEKKQIESEKGRHYKLLTDHDGGFFAYSNGNELEEYRSDGTLIKKHNLATELQNIEKMLYMDGKLFAMYYLKNNVRDKYLAECNLENGEFKKIDIDNVQNFVNCGENTLLIFLKQDCCSGHMLTYDITSGEKSDEFHILNLPFFLHSYYNSSKDHLYLISQGTIYVASVEEKKMIETYTSGIIPKRFAVYCKNNISYFIDKDKKRIVSLDLDDLSSSKNITILCHDFAPESRFSRAAYDFGIENNDTGVKFINISTEEYTTKLNTMLMSGDNSFDVYLLSTFNDIPSYYIKKGAYEDLHNYSVVSQKFDDMFEGIEKLCSYNDALFGVPVGIYNSDTVYQLNTLMLKEHNLEMPAYDWTWIDFEKYAEVITADATNFMMQQTKSSFWLFNIYAVSNCFKMDLTNDAFNYTKTDIKNELEFVDKIYEKRIIHGEERSYKKQGNLLLNFVYLPTNDGSLDGVKIIPAPVFNDKRAYPFRVNYLCMNKASKNKQLAAEFLGKCISKEAQAVDLVTQIPILYKDKSVYGGSIYKNFINDNWNYNVYSYMIKNSYRNESYGFYLDIRDYVVGYFEGRISSDEAAEAIYSKMKQVVEE
jgi:ABC-type glycerol-3-phosphate transport system substrate-binding protein